MKVINFLPVGLMRPSLRALNSSIGRSEYSFSISLKQIIANVIDILHNFNIFFSVSREGAVGIGVVLDDLLDVLGELGAAADLLAEVVGEAGMD